jgi:hypothetical protein
MLNQKNSAESPIADEPLDSVLPIDLTDSEFKMLR